MMSPVGVAVIVLLLAGAVFAAKMISSERNKVYDSESLAESFEAAMEPEPLPIDTSTYEPALEHVYDTEDADTKSSWGGDDSGSSYDSSDSGGGGFGD